MAVSRRLLSIFVLAVVTLAVLLTSPLPSWAADRPGNQAMDQPASLVGPKPDAKITVYLRPEASESHVGYGVNGDAVTVLEQVSDNQSVIWNHIRFDSPSHAEGWVQAAFISLKADTPGQSQRQSQRQSQQMAEGDSYLGSGLGNRLERQPPAASGRSQFNQQQSPQSYPQTYSQRNQN
ncbi:MAG: SH3 domain-containing protein [Phormidesmis sp.]